MAKFRQLHTSFWQDSFIVDLTPEEKYFFIYLMTNPKTTQCGIYELPLRVIEMETGYNRETVEKLIKRFEEYGKIVYSRETKEICIVNWLKYNNIRSPKVQSCIKKEIGLVKNTALIQKLNGIDTALNRINTVSDGIDRPCIDLGEEEEKEIIKENIKKITPSMKKEEKPVDEKSFLINQFRAKARSVELKNGNHSIKLFDWLNERFPSYRSHLRGWVNEWFLYFVEKRLQEGKDPLNQHPVVYKSSLENFILPRVQKERSKAIKPVY